MASSTSSRKLIDKLRAINNDEKRPFYSFEYFPPKTAAGVANLYARIEHMAQLEPAFIDVTWGAGGTTSDLTMEISANAQAYAGVDVMMHLTCTNMPQEKLRLALEEAKRNGIRNILALRGDPPRDADSFEACAGGFSYATDLVRFIRAEFGDFFCVCVSGYPEGHLECTSLDDDLRHLKDKVDAGADFIITQLFYDVDIFLQFVQRCRAIGIVVPIIPGIMPIQSYQGFKRMTGFCKTHVPQFISDELEPIKDDDERVKAYGIKLGVDMCRRLLDAGIEGLHFYTLNLERSTVKIMEGLGLIATKSAKRLPWVPSQVTRRKGEEVRPIFWANRPKSYLQRTMSWDEFPNGRWGDGRSPAFGDLSDYHLCSLTTAKAATRTSMWGEAPSSYDDVAAVFCKYIRGEIPKLPWCETQLNLETVSLVDFLVRMNSALFLSINSQPRINGAPSTDAAVGWGAVGGYVFQKAYLEFFTPAFNVERILHVVKKHPHITFHAINADGQSLSNCVGSTNAVTWGVFPGREIIQPTVVDYNSFGIWKDEAFALWTSQWGSAYAAESESARLFETIRSQWWLVNIVDNDFVNGDISKFITEVLDTAVETVDADCHVDVALLACAKQIAEEAASGAVDLYDA